MFRFPMIREQRQQHWDFVMFKRLSYSMMRCYLDCPHNFEMRYVKHVPVTLSGRTVAGRVYHHGVEFALKRKKEEKPVTPEEVKDIMRDRWEKEVKGVVAPPVSFYESDCEEVVMMEKKLEWGDDKPGEVKDAVLKLAGIYVEKFVPTIYPHAVEERFTAIVNGVPFVAYPDLVVAGPGVIDHKFATRRANQDYIDKDLQFTTYAAVLGKPIWAAWHQALDLKRPEIFQILTERKQDDIEWLGRVAADVWQGICAGYFPRNPLGWKCNGRCEYHIECRVLMED